MNFNNLLEQLLSSAQKASDQFKQSDNKADTIAKVGGGAAALGILSMLLGRGGGAGLTKIGSLAALGSLAYQAYQNYQKNNTQGDMADLPAQHAETSEHAGEEASKVILRAMIAAAAADGEIDEQERQLIANESGDDIEIQQWLAQEMSRPATVNEIAEQVGNNAVFAAEVYLAARMVCVELSRKEIVFLAQLAQALNLDEKFVEQLEKQAGFH